MSHIIEAAQRFKSRCYEMKLEYPQIRCDNKISREIVFGVAQTDPFWSAIPPLVGKDIVDELTIDGDGQEVSQNSKTGTPYVTALSQPINTAIQQEDNLTLVDEHRFYKYDDCNCQGKEEGQLVSNASFPITADSEYGTENPEIGLMNVIDEHKFPNNFYFNWESDDTLKAPAEISPTSTVDSKYGTKNPEVIQMIDALNESFAAALSVLASDSKYINADKNDVSTISNIESALDAVEVLVSSSAYSTSSDNCASSGRSIHSSPLKQLFKKRRKGAVKISSLTADCNYLTKSAQDDHAVCGEMNEERVIRISRKRSIDRHVLKPSTSPLPVQSSSIVQNVIRPAHLNPKENSPPSSEELEVKNGPSPVEGSSSVYFSPDEAASAPPRFHILVEKTSYVKRSSSEYSRAGSASTSHSGGLSLNGKCHCFDSLEKNGINGSRKAVENRCLLQSSVISTGNAAVRPYGAKLLDNDLANCKIEESPTEAGHQTSPTVDSGLSTITGLCASKLSRQSKANEDANAAGLNSSICLDPPVKPSRKNRKYPKILSSAERRKLYSKTLLINEHGEYEYPPSLTGEQCYYESIEDMKYIIKLLQISLKDDTNNHFYTKQESDRFSHELIDLKKRVKVLTKRSTLIQKEVAAVESFKPSTSKRINSSGKREISNAVDAEESAPSFVHPLGTQCLNEWESSFKDGLSDASESDLSFTLDSDMSEKQECTSIDPNLLQWIESFRGGSNISSSSNCSDVCNNTVPSKCDSVEEQASFEETIEELPETHLDDEEIVDKETRPTINGNVIAKPTAVNGMRFEEIFFNGRVKHGNMLAHMTIEERQQYTVGCLGKAIDEYEKNHGPICCNYKYSP